MAEQEESGSISWPESRPQLSSVQLILREPDHGDASAYVAMYDDLDIARMTGSIPAIYHPHAANGWISCSLGGFKRKRRIDWTIIERETECVAGTIGLFKRPQNSVWEIGYSLLRDFWGKGYATEAAQTVMNWAHGTLGVDKIVAGHFCDNPASRRVLEKLGFRQIGEPILMYSLARGEKAPGLRYIWPANKADEKHIGRLH